MEQVKAMGIKQVLSAPRSPWQRAYVERVSQLELSISIGHGYYGCAWSFPEQCLRSLVSHHQKTNGLFTGKGHGIYGVEENRVSC